MRWLARRLPIATAIPVSFVVYVGLCGTASAHVKWFCAYNVAGQPDGLENVLCLDFEFLTGLSILALDGGLAAGRHAGRHRHAAGARPRDRPHARQYRDHFPLQRRVLLHRHLGRRRHPADARAQDQLDFDRRHSARHRRRHGVAPHHAVIGVGNFRAVRRSPSGITACFISPTIRSSSASPPISL